MITTSVRRIQTQIRDSGVERNFKQNAFYLVNRNIVKGRVSKQQLIQGISIMIEMSIKILNLLPIKNKAKQIRELQTSLVELPKNKEELPIWWDNLKDFGNGFLCRSCTEYEERADGSILPGRWWSNGKRSGGGIGLLIEELMRGWF